VILFLLTAYLIAKVPDNLIILQTIKHISTLYLKSQSICREETIVDRIKAQVEPLSLEQM
jgi:hypothetical protein